MGFVSGKTLAAVLAPFEDLSLPCPSSTDKPRILAAIGKIMPQKGAQSGNPTDRSHRRTVAKSLEHQVIDEISAPAHKVSGVALSFLYVP